MILLTKFNNVVYNFIKEYMMKLKAYIFRIAFHGLSDEFATVADSLEEAQANVRVYASMYLGAADITLIRTLV